MLKERIRFLINDNLEMTSSDEDDGFYSESDSESDSDSNN